jgi:ectoine hydroxylase-related dioxygenase (phytanoyl-CoA dioxygenase family)
MLEVEVVPSANVERATEVFFRDGFVALSGVLSDEQLHFAQEGARRVVAEQIAATPFEMANRGYARYSFGQQVQHPEWAMLVDLPTVLPILDAIWGSEDYTCSGAGGDYSNPGAKIQHLHSDMNDMLNDPLGQANIYDLPAPFIVVNYLMTEFAEINGAIRFVPGTQRTRLRPPSIENEPAHWKESIVCAPAGTAVLRDVRCWHGGTANNSDAPRIMTSAGYFAPWFRRGGSDGALPLERYNELSERGKKLCRYIVDWEGK